MLSETAPLAEPAGFAAVTLLAVLQGATEFLPVSSSGHLVLAGEWLGVSGGGLLLSVALHAGTLIAVLLVYRRTLLELAREAGRGELRELGLLLVGSLPAAAVGLGTREGVEALFEDTRPAALGLLVTAAFLLVGDQYRRRRERRGVPGRERLRLGDALAIGLAQAVAIHPGISRSGSTISTALVLGLSAERAACFSFLLSLPAVGGATLLEARVAWTEGLGGLDPLHLAWGMALAALVGWGALRGLLAVLERGAFRWFAVYCLLLGVLAGLFL